MDGWDGSQLDIHQPDKAAAVWPRLLDEEAKAKKKTPVSPFPSSGMQGNTQSQELGFPFETEIHSSQTGCGLCVSKDSFQLLVLLSLHLPPHPIPGCWSYRLVSLCPV